jgi:hypothetical protein
MRDVHVLLSRPQKTQTFLIQKSDANGKKKGKGRKKEQNKTYRNRSLKLGRLGGKGKRVHCAVWRMTHQFFHDTQSHPVNSYPVNNYPVT